MKPLLGEAYLLGVFVARLAYGRLLDMPESMMSAARQSCSELLAMLRAPHSVALSVDELASHPATAIEMRSERAAEMEGKFLRLCGSLAHWLQTSVSEDHATAFDLGFSLFHAMIFADLAARDRQATQGFLCALPHLRELAMQLQVDPAFIEQADRLVRTGTPANGHNDAQRVLAKALRATLIGLGGFHLTDIAGR